MKEMNEVVVTNIFQPTFTPRRPENIPKHEHTHSLNEIQRRTRSINATAEFTADTPWKTGWKQSTNWTKRTIPRRRKKSKSADAADLSACSSPSAKKQTAARKGGALLPEM
jgi:hypothetical protein